MEMPNSDLPESKSDVNLPKRKRLITRRRIRTASFIRDVLASIKDAGLISIVIALLIFNEDVAEFIHKRDLTLNGNGYVVDTQSLLKKLNKAADSVSTLPFSDESYNQLSDKLLRTERKLLGSEDAIFITDWIAVIASSKDISLIENIKSKIPSDLKLIAVNKRELYYFIIPAKDPEEVTSVLNKVRQSFPRAVPTSMQSWCPLQEKNPDLYISCQ